MRGTGRRFLVVPAIDLRAGRCVRLVRGSFDEVTRYDTEPAARARSFAAAGASLIHLVDLDAAEGRGADNRAAIAAIRAAVGCRLEVGGGVRSLGDARALADLGADLIVVGTALARAPKEVARWAALLPGRLVAGIDARDGAVRVAGWTADGGLRDLDLAARAISCGLASIVYTSIDRDGTLAGPDIERTLAVARAARCATILSGGIGSADDVRRVAAAAAEEPLLAGVIVGRALYEGSVDLEALLAEFPPAP